MVRKRICVPMMTLCLLLCSCGTEEMNREDVQSCYQHMERCTMEAVVRCEQDGMEWEAELHCEYIPEGASTVEVLSPETIAGITGTIAGQEGKLTFGDTALAFELLAEGRLSPVSAPWVLIHTLHQGYLTACSETDSGLVLSINDRYEENALNLSVYLGDDDLPTGAEIFWEGSRILSLTVANFSFL